MTTKESPRSVEDTVMSAAPRAALDLPLKVLVWGARRRTNRMVRHFV